MNENDEACDALQWWSEVGARQEYEEWLKKLDEQRMKLLQQENAYEQIQSNG